MESRFSSSFGCGVVTTVQPRSLECRILTSEYDLINPLFSNTFHYWIGNYNNGTLNDVVAPGSTTVTATVKTDWIGYNVVDRTFGIQFCDEYNDWNYYIEVSNNCLSLVLISFPKS